MYFKPGIKLSFAVPLQLTVQPRGRTVMFGDTVILCCEADGQPPPSNIEW